MSNQKSESSSSNIVCASNPLCLPLRALSDMLREPGEKGPGERWPGDKRGGISTFIFCLRFSSRYCFAVRSFGSGRASSRSTDLRVLYVPRMNKPPKRPTIAATPR